MYRYLPSHGTMQRCVLDVFVMVLVYSTRTTYSFEHSRLLQGRDKHIVLPPQTLSPTEYNSSNHQPREQEQPERLKQQQEKQQAASQAEQPHVSCPRTVGVRFLNCRNVYDRYSNVKVGFANSCILRYPASNVAQLFPNLAQNLLVCILSPCHGKSGAVGKAESIFKDMKKHGSAELSFANSCAT